MNTAGTFKKKLVGILLGAAIGVCVLAVPGSAFAQFNNGTLTHVEYFFNGGAPQLLLQQNGNSSVNYYAYLTQQPGCGVTNVDIDTMKIWISIAQAAELSGKSTTIYYTPCNGLNYITDVVMYN